MLIACSIFRQNLPYWLSRLISTQFSMSRILKTYTFLMPQFMLIMSQQFIITLEQRFQASTNRSGS